MQALEAEEEARLWRNQARAAYKKALAAQEEAAHG